jgi:hypothetical protein
LFSLEYDVCAFQHTEPMDVGMSNQNNNNDIVSTAAYRPKQKIVILNQRRLLKA